MRSLSWGKESDLKSLATERASQQGGSPWLALAQKPLPPHAVDHVWSLLHLGSHAAVGVRCFSQRLGAQSCCPFLELEERTGRLSSSLADVSQVSNRTRLGRGKRIGVAEGVPVPALVLLAPPARSRLSQPRSAERFEVALDVADAEAEPVSQLLHRFVDPLGAVDHSAPTGGEGIGGSLDRAGPLGPHIVGNVAHEGSVPPIEVARGGLPFPASSWRTFLQRNQEWFAASSKTPGSWRSSGGFPLFGPIWLHKDGFQPV